MFDRQRQMAVVRCAPPQRKYRGRSKLRTRTALELYGRATPRGMGPVRDLSFEYPRLRCVAVATLAIVTVASTTCSLSGGVILTPSESSVHRAKLKSGKRDIFVYQQHGRYVCNPTEAVSNLDLQKGHVAPRAKGTASLKDTVGLPTLRIQIVRSKPTPCGPAYLPAREPTPHTPT